MVKRCLGGGACENPVGMGLSMCDGLMETQIYVGQYLVHARLDFKYRGNGYIMYSTFRVFNKPEIKCSDQGSFLWRAGLEFAFHS